MPTAIQNSIAKARREQLVKEAEIEKPDKINRTVLEKSNVSLVKSEFAQAISAGPGVTRPNFIDTIDQIRRGKTELSVPIKRTAFIDVDRDEMINIKAAQGKNTAIQQAVQSAARGGHSIEIEETRVGETSLLHKAATAINIEEHAAVKAMYAPFELFGRKPKADLSDYTYANLYIDAGADKSSNLTHATGFVTSILLAPSTYASFGATGALKISVRAGIVLSKKGLQVANKVKRIEAATQAAKLGRDLTKKEFAKIGKEVESGLAKNFLAINNKGIKLRKTRFVDLRKVDKDLFDLGGIKLETLWVPRSLEKAAPFLVQSKNIISGKTIAKWVDVTGISSLYQFAAKLGPIAATTKGLSKLFVTDRKRVLSEIADVNRRIFKGVKGPQTVALKQERKLLVRQLDDLKAESNILKTAEEMKLRAERGELRIIRRTKQWFSGLSKRQRTDFSDSALEASILSERTGTRFEVRSGGFDPIVQKRLDKFFGQSRDKSGKFLGFNGKGMADRLGDKAKLLEGTKIPLWFPGIDKNFLNKILRFDKEIILAKRAFNKERKDADLLRYINQPISALSIRRTQILFANLQDEMYEQVIKQYGVSEAKEGFSLLNKPSLAGLIDDARFVERAKDIQTKKMFVPDSVKEAFGNIITREKETSVFTALSARATNLWKLGVTSTFPPFHARNFTSNLILN